jgi:hypothetical protein
VSVIRLLPLDKQQRVVMENPEAVGGGFTMLPRGGIPGNKPEFILLNSEENIQKCLEFRYRHVLEPCKSLSQFFVFINKPYRLNLLYLVSQMFDMNGEYEDLLTYAWTSTEFPHQMRIPELVRMFEKADLNKLMDVDDRRKYDELPDEITVYRGLQDGRAKRRGLSWTTDQEVAVWFASRWHSGESKVLQATIRKSKVYMYSDGRNEKECVVNPRYLKNVRQIA